MAKHRITLIAGDGIGPEISSAVVKILETAGLDVEWDEVMKIVRKCHMTVMKKGERVLTNINIDDRKGMPNRIDAKVKSIERRIGKPLKK